MDNYGIERRNPLTGLWIMMEIIKPDFKKEKKKFLGIIPYTVISTEDTNETMRIKVSKRALEYYYKLINEDVRITELGYDLDEHTYYVLRVIWKNGEWL